MKILILALAITLSTGCAKHLPIANTFSGQGMKIGSVIVTQGTLPPEREDRAKRIDLINQTKTRIETNLTRHQLLDPSSPIVMKIHINDFRLRHGATKYFTGFLSGSDRIGAQLTVTNGTTTYITKSLKESGGNWNPFTISSSSRGANLSAAVANLAVAALSRDETESQPASQPVIAIAESRTVVEAAEPQSEDASEQEKPAKVSKAAVASCTIEQVLSLKRNGFSDEQVQAACADGAR